jgi:hypothetical protein
VLPAKQTLSAGTYLDVQSADLQVGERDTHIAIHMLSVQQGSKQVLEKTIALVIVSQKCVASYRRHPMIHPHHTDAGA